MKWLPIMAFDFFFSSLGIKFLGFFPTKLGFLSCRKGDFMNDFFFFFLGVSVYFSRVSLSLEAFSIFF